MCRCMDVWMYVFMYVRYVCMDAMYARCVYVYIVYDAYTHAHVQIKHTTRHGAPVTEPTCGLVGMCMCMCMFHAQSYVIC